MTEQFHFNVKTIEFPWAMEEYQGLKDNAQSQYFDWVRDAGNGSHGKLPEGVGKAHMACFPTPAGAACATVEPVLSHIQDSANATRRASHEALQFWVRQRSSKKGKDLERQEVYSALAESARAS